MSREKQYWGFRIDVNNSNVYPDYYNTELEENRVLRQGWGHEGHDLRTLDYDSAPDYLKPNFRMYNEVKKGDIILVPRIPEWGSVTIAEATEDWDTDYRFGNDPDKEGYGHQFPARCITHFNRHNEHVDGNIRSTLRCQHRFWWIWCAESIDSLIGRKPGNLNEYQDRKHRFIDVVENVMRPNNEIIEKGIHEKLSEQFSGADWEYALAAGLEKLFPHYRVERVGGRGENEHGTDVLVTIPGILEDYSDYGIAIQIKDWQGVAHNVYSAIEQLEKADKSWMGKRGLRIIEKIVIVTGARLPEGLKSGEILEKHGVAVLHSRELKKLLRRMALVTAAAMDE